MNDEIEQPIVSPAIYQALNCPLEYQLVDCPFCYGEGYFYINDFSHDVLKQPCTVCDRTGEVYMPVD